MITTICTCDKCGTVITDSNKMPTAIIMYGVSTNYVVGIRGTSEHSANHFCLHCFIDAINVLDDRPKAESVKGGRNERT